MVRAFFCPEALLTSLAGYASPGDNEFAKQVTDCFETGDDDGIESDPSIFMMEQVFEDMDPDDKNEFPDVKAALARKKLKRAGVAAKRKFGVRKKRRVGGGPPDPAPPEPPPPPPAAGAVPGPVDPHAVPGAPAAEPGGGRGPNVLPYPLSWVDVKCLGCNALVGHIKYLPSPGGRDGASWNVRVWDATSNCWGRKAPYLRTVRCTVIGESDVGPIGWVRHHRGQCAC